MPSQGSQRRARSPSHSKPGQLVREISIRKATDFTLQAAAGKPYATAHCMIACNFQPVPWAGSKASLASIRYSICMNLSFCLSVCLSFFLSVFLSFFLYFFLSFRLVSCSSFCSVCTLFLDCYSKRAFGQVFGPTTRGVVSRGTPVQFLLSRRENTRTQFKKYGKFTNSYRFFVSSLSFYRVLSTSAKSTGHSKREFLPLQYFPHSEHRSTPSGLP